MFIERIVILTGAGVSAASGLSTFRDGDGLWEKHRIEDVATPKAWRKNPRLVLDFYNERRSRAAEATPNAAHFAIASLEDRFDVTVVTQNVDDLHERAGSKCVMHLHGELTKARSTRDASLIYPIGSKSIHIGDTCELGSQLRPHIVWFGEKIHNEAEAMLKVLCANKLVVVGTSLTVYPAAGLLMFSHPSAQKFYVDICPEDEPEGFEVIKGAAELELKKLFTNWK